MNILNKKESAIKMRLVRLREKIQRIIYGKKL
ncbi:MAG: hypothetical protein KatS3mg129_1411 [Leptospiraceae bacterium]|nr:MAG: hypothetical protein KatS3mg129_1411 [Leptospiraceae bacterium]